MLGTLLAIHIIVCICLIVVVLLQQSEGGALGMGGGPTGFMTTRGAGDLLTRTTWILATLFFVLSLALTVLTGRSKGESSVVDRVKIENVAPSQLKKPAQPAPAAPSGLEAPAPSVRDPFAGATGPAEKIPAKP